MKTSIPGQMNFQIMQQESGKIKDWLWPTLAFLCFYILAGYSKNLIFHLNDDAYVILMAKSGEFHTPDTHSILGWFFKTVYSWQADFFWYDFFMVLFYMAAISRLFFIFNAYQTLSFSGLLLVISCILVGFLPFQPNFTILSIFLTIVALLPYLIGEAKGISPFTWKNSALSGLFVIIACLYRSPAVFLTAGTALMIHSALSIHERIRKGKGGSKGHFLRPAAYISGIIAFSLFMQGLNVYLYKIYPEYDRLIDYDKYRKGFVDYFRYSYDQSYQACGISSNDFNLMRHFMGIDSPPLDLENLEKLPRVSIFNPRRLMLGFFNTCHCLKQSCALTLLLILLCVSVFSRRSQICAAVSLLVIFLIGIVTCRMHLRVCLPLLAFGTLTALMFIRPELKKHKKWPLPFIIIIVSIMTLVVAARYQLEKVGQYKHDLKSAARLWKFCESHHIDNLAYWPLAVTFDNRILFSADPLPASIRLNRIGGWTGSYPRTIKTLQNIYGENIYKGLAQPGTFHLVMNHPMLAPYFETFIKEHGPDKARPTIVFKTNRTILYLVSSSPG